MIELAKGTRGGKRAAGGASTGIDTNTREGAMAYAQEVIKTSNLEGNLNVYKNGAGLVVLNNQSDRMWEYRDGFERVGAYNAVKDKNGNWQISEVEAGFVSDNVFSDAGAAGAAILRNQSGAKARLEIEARQVSAKDRRAFASYSSQDPQSKTNPYFTVASRYDYGKSIRSKTFSGKSIEETRAKANSWIEEQKKTAVIKPKSKKK